MNGNVVAALVNLALFGAFMAAGWYIAAISAVVCIAFSLTMAAMDS